MAYSKKVVDKFEKIKKTYKLKTHDTKRKKGARKKLK
jgi:hypothetical protein